MTLRDLKGVIKFKRRVVGLLVCSLTFTLCAACPVHFTTTYQQQQENESKQAQAAIHFAVVTSVFQRPQDAGFTIPCLTAFSSVARQTYTEWTLIVVGDGLTQQEIGLALHAAEVAGIPRSKLVFQNMDEKMREKHIYSDPHDLWSHAGTNALNMALRIAYNQSHVTHIARIDDDDYWLPAHLDHLVEAYKAYASASFAYTQALGFAPSPAPFPASNQTDRLQLLPPVPCNLIHATTSWSKSLVVFYRQAQEQQNSTRGSMCCDGPCVAGVVLPADADLWERIHSMVETGAIASVFVQIADVHYTDTAKKACLAAIISGQNLPECDTLLDHVHAHDSACLSVALLSCNECALAGQ